jgi:hypothetical protein
MSSDNMFQFTILGNREVFVKVMSMCVAQFILVKVGVLPWFRTCRLFSVRKDSNTSPLAFAFGEPQMG